MSLYLEHFGLREPPFRITPHTDFFFSGANRGPTLDALVYAIIHDEGIVKVTGEVGSGKTMLCRMLLERLPAQVEALYLANPSLSRHEILAAIADELGVTTRREGTHSLKRALQDALLTRYAEGRRVVLLVDEAHAMPAESLEEVRLLSNLESRSAKLLQIVLFAQPELEERLAASDMRQLRERITQHFFLAPLARPDIATYLEFRLRAAGYHGPNPFTTKALEMIGRSSAGLSRRINILADKALLAAYSRGRHQIGPVEARTAIRDARFTPLGGQRPPWAWLLAGGTAIATVVGAAILLIPLLDTGPAPPEPAAATSPSPPPAPPPTPAPVPVAAVSIPLAPLPASEATPSPAVVAKTHALPPTSAKPAAADVGTLTATHLAYFDAWLPAADRNHYFLQLAIADAANTVQLEALLTRLGKQLEMEQLRAYRSRLQGQERIGIIYGEYETREAALAALKAFPEGVKIGQPFPRQVAKLL